MKAFFRPVDIAALAFFRILFGILAFADVMGLWAYYHLYKDAYNPENFHFLYYGFDWVQAMSSVWMSIFLVSLLGASCCIVIGYRYRAACLYFALGFTYMFLLEKGNYLNHGYLFCMLSFLMIFLPANRAYSRDILRKPQIHTQQIPFWNIFLLRFMMGVVYVFGGIAKLNPDWLNGMPLKIWLKSKASMPIIGAVLAQEWTAYFMSYGGLLLDLCVVPFLLFKKTRWWVLAAVLFFHLTNTIIFKIGIFPWLSIGLTLLFFPSDFPRRVFEWLKVRWRFVFKIEKWWTNLLEKYNAKSPFYQNHLFQHKKAITGVVIVFCSIQILLPLRHHYFKGQVAWTEEGHRYAWRMMLRHKAGTGYFKVINSESDAAVTIRPKRDLPLRQARKLMTHPDMILQYAHHLRDRYQEEWQTDSVEVYAFIRCRLNGGQYQRYIDPECDLAREEWHFFKASPWILPLSNKK